MIIITIIGIIKATSMKTSIGVEDSNFLMDDVKCRGDERRLSECRHITSHNCGNHEGAGVICSSLTLADAISDGVSDDSSNTAAKCKEECEKIGCHGYVFVDDDPANDENLRGRCYPKFGNAYVTGVHSQKTTANLMYQPSVIAP